MAAVVPRESPMLFINAAREPDVVDLHDVEPDGRTGRRCGSADNDHHRCPAACIQIEHRVIGDRIVKAATWGIAAANDPW